MASQKVASEKDYECYLQNTLGINIWLVQVCSLEKKIHIPCTILINKASPDTKLQSQTPGRNTGSSEIKRCSDMSSNCREKCTPGSLADQLWCLWVRHSSYLQTTHKAGILILNICSSLFWMKLVKIFPLAHLRFHQPRFSGNIIRKFKKQILNKLKKENSIYYYKYEEMKIPFPAATKGFWLLLPTRETSLQRACEWMIYVDLTFIYSSRKAEWHFHFLSVEIWWEKLKLVNIFSEFT